MPCAGNLPPKPRPGTPCPCCGEAMHPSNMHADHCHHCDPKEYWHPRAFRGWICSKCNPGIHEHIERHWSSVQRYLSQHICHAELPGMPIRSAIQHPIKHSAPSAHYTKYLSLSNGTHDSTFIIVSDKPGYVTIQQAAAWFGVAGSTIRNWIARGIIQEVWQPEPENKQGIRLIPHHEAIRLTNKRFGSILDEDPPPPVCEMRAT